MQELDSNREAAIKYHTISVPENIKIAKVEILTFKGAPAFLGTMLAKLHFDNNQTVVLYSEMSGVVDNVLVNNADTVTCGQRLLELRNTNVSRTKGGNKMNPSNLPVPRPCGKFFETKKNRKKKKSHLLVDVSDLSRKMR